MIEKVGKNWVGKTFLLPAIGPEALKHSMAGTDPNLLWDNVSFALELWKQRQTQGVVLRVDK
ncbi:MAG: hypothetical protein M0C28_34110 [Candidatus Moduliflexus flocculans]|nr:hypothetical protein [Candidatus Moduliflexus flocculans]